MLINIFKWIWKAWPIVAWGIIVSVHQSISLFTCLTYLPCWSDEQIDKVVSLILNVVGGILVLYSIDSNLGLFRQGGIFKSFIKWLKSFPMLKSKPIIIPLTSVSSTISVHSPRVEIVRPPETIEELYEYTKNQVAFIKSDIKEQRNSTDNKINSLSRKTSSENEKLNKNLGNIDEQLKSLAIGGFKFQIFGVLLLIYASFLSYFI